MGEAERIQVLQRKARTGREEHQARVMTPQRALRLSLARVAEDLFGLSLRVSSIHAEEVGQSGVIAAFSEDRLSMVLDGPGGALGAVGIELPILAGLIEMQTMGQVLEREPDARIPTQTDAALVAPLLDGMLDAFAENLAGEEAQTWARGYRFGAMVEGPRMLGLMLEAPDFHLFRLQVELGNGAKRGELVIALPAIRAPSPACDPDDDTAQQPCGKLLGQGALMTAKASMMAVLHRAKMPLAEVSGLQVGDVLSIPREALATTRLEAGNGRRGVDCRLGQINGFRAVRMTAPGQMAGLIGPTDEDESGFGADLAGAADRPAPHDGTLIDAVTTVEDLPGLPGLGELPDAATPAAAADLSDLPGLGDGMGLEDLPDLGDLPEMAELGDLSDLPELSLED